MEEKDEKILDNLRNALEDYSGAIRKEMHDAVTAGKSVEEMEGLIKSIAYFTATFSKVRATEKNDACKVSNCYYMGE